MLRLLSRLVRRQPFCSPTSGRFQCHGFQGEALGTVWYSEGLPECPAPGSQAEVGSVLATLVLPSWALRLPFMFQGTYLEASSFFLHGDQRYLGPAGSAAMCCVPLTVAAHDSWDWFFLLPSVSSARRPFKEHLAINNHMVSMFVKHFDT